MGTWVYAGEVILAGGTAVLVVALTAAAALGVISPLIPAAAGVGAALGLVVRVVAAWSSSEPTGTRSRLLRILTSKWTWLLLVFAISITLTTVLLSGPYYMIRETILARVPYRGVAVFGGSPESWQIHHRLELGTDELEHLADEGINGDVLVAQVRAEGWQTAQLLGGGWEFTRDEAVAGPVHVGIEVEATSSLAAPRISLDGPDFTLIIIEPVAGSGLELSGPLGALHATTPASSASTLGAESIEQRVVELDADTREVVIEVIRPGVRGSPITQLVGLTPIVAVSGGISLLLGVWTVLRTKLIGSVANWLMRLFGRAPESSTPANGPAEP